MAVQGQHNSQEQENVSGVEELVRQIREARSAKEIQDLFQGLPPDHLRRQLVARHIPVALMKEPVAWKTFSESHMWLSFLEREDVGEAMVRKMVRWYADWTVEGVPHVKRSLMEAIKSLSQPKSAWAADETLKIARVEWMKESEDEPKRAETEQLIGGLLEMEINLSEDDLLDIWSNSSSNEKRRLEEKVVTHPAAGSRVWISVLYSGKRIMGRTTAILGRILSMAEGRRDYSVGAFVLGQSSKDDLIKILPDIHPALVREALWTIKGWATPVMIQGLRRISAESLKGQIAQKDLEMWLQHEDRNVRLIAASWASALEVGEGMELGAQEQTVREKKSAGISNQ